MISIVIPVFNAEKYLSKCLDSIINQSFSEFEIILVNDGSTDKTLNICESFTNKDSRILLINQQNKGISSSRNTGIKHAKYPYITFVDSDDWLEKTSLEVLFSLITKHDADISICGHFTDNLNKTQKTSNPKSDKIKVYSKSEALSLIFMDNYIKHYVWGKLYKTELFNDIKFPENTFYEDIYTTYKVFDKANLVVKTDQLLLHYVQHGANFTSSNSPKKWLDAFNGFLEQLHFIRENKTRLKHVLKIELVMAKQFYRLKKSLLLDFDIKSQIFLEYETLANKTMLDAIKHITVSDMKPLFYIKYKTAIYYPELFLKYLIFTRGVNKNRKPVIK